MALTDEGGSTGMVMPVAPYYGGGNGAGWGGDSGWWFILLILAMFGGWGGGFGGVGAANAAGFDMAMMYPWMNQSNQIQAGFDNAALTSTVTGLQNSITSGFGDVQNALCGGFAGVNASIANGFAQSEIANNARQMANMQQVFGLSQQFSDCCCENRLANCQTNNTIVAESAATRSTIQSAVQTVLDKLCADKIDEKNEKIVELQNKLNMADFAASQASQNNYLQNALTAQTQYFLGLYPPPAATTTPATTAA